MCELEWKSVSANTVADAERWAAGIGCPAYAIDDDTAMKVVDGSVEVVSEGHWRFFDMMNELAHGKEA